MKKFLLTLIVTMLTCLGAWADDGVVTLSPAPGTLNWHLIDDAQGQTFGISSPQYDERPYNVDVSVVYANTGESASDIVGYSLDNNNRTIKITPVKVTAGAVELKVKVSYSGWVAGVYGTWNDFSDVFSVSINNASKVPATLSVPAVRMGNVGKTASVTASDGLVAGTDYTVEYSSAPTSVLEIDPSTGVITPVSEGAAQITAVVTPIGDAADTYVAKTLTADVQVLSDLHATFTVSPSANSTIDVSNTAGEKRTLNPANIDGYGWSFNVTITGDQVVEYSLNNSELTIKPKAGAGLGTATVTVKTTWTKYGTTDDFDDAEVSFNVTVDDQSLVKTLTVPQAADGEEYIEIQKGKETIFPILFAPYTAEFQAPQITTTGNITVRYALKEKENPEDPEKSDYNILIVDATSAAIDDEATITITPKAGSPAEAKTFKVKVGKPELPVTDIMPQTIFRVGDLVNAGLAIPADANIPEDEYEVVYTSSDENVITVNDGGSIIAHHVGEAKITVRFTPKSDTDADANYKEWYREMNVLVKPAKLNLSLSVSPNEFTAGLDLTQAGDISVGASNLPDGATWVLSVEGTEDAEIDGATLKIKPNAPAQTFVVKLTVTSNNADYESFETTAQILVEGNASEGVILSKGTITVKDADGNDVEEDLIIVNVPTSGAFGTPVDDDPTWTSTDETTLQMLKEAQHVKVTGLLANSDVQELVHLIGGVASGNANTSVCTSLDMGEAKMTEQITSDGTYCSFVPSNYKYMGSVKELVLPQPALGVDGGTVLPANFNTFFGNKDNHSLNDLESLTIPEGWTEIADYFCSYDGTGATTFQKLTTLKLANSIEKIGAFAFADLRVKVLDMPYNIKRINKCAFSPCSKLQDVYFRGPAPEFVHTNAFAGQTQFCNNSVKDTQLQGVTDPTITRFEYYNGDGDNRVLACILHYPKEHKEDYIDMTRKYDVIPDGVAYSKGANIFTPDYWTPTFINNVKAALKARYPNQIPNLSFDDADPNIYVGTVLDYGVKDATYGYSMIWPSQSQMTTGFGIAQAGYQWGGDPLDPIYQYDPSSTYYKDGSIDKRGLYQFIVALDNADIDFKFEQDQWYTISLPFDMTADQVKAVFGPKTQVCRFSGVTREVNGEDDKTLRLEFRNSTMGDRTGDFDGTSYEADGMEPAGTYTGIRHHYPYMIKPSGTVDNEYIVEKDGKWHFYGDGFTGITGTLQHDKITADGVEYVFAPNLSETAIKKNSYILMERKDKAMKNGKFIHEYVFFKGVSKFGGASYVDGGKANQNTSYVQLSPEDGVKEFNDFFKDKTSIVFNGSSHAAPINASIFGFEDDETNTIEKVEIVCGTDRVPDNKVYTINGQLVNSSVLAPGLYIKNGKKFIVK